MQVVSGTVDISNGTGGGTVSSVSTLIAHKAYSTSTNANNIAILKVSIPSLPLFVLLIGYIVFSLNKLAPMQTYSVSKKGLRGSVGKVCGLCARIENEKHYVY
jgi:hypothetical protein